LGGEHCLDRRPNLSCRFHPMVVTRMSGVRELRRNVRIC
jgi:hypothetical protein